MVQITPASENSSPYKAVHFIFWKLYIRKFFLKLGQNPYPFNFCFFSKHRISEWFFHLALYRGISASVVDSSFPVSPCHRRGRWSLEQSASQLMVKLGMNPGIQLFCSSPTFLLPSLATMWLKNVCIWVHRVEVLGLLSFFPFCCHCSIFFLFSFFTAGFLRDSRLFLPY